MTLPPAFVSAGVPLDQALKRQESWSEGATGDLQAPDAVCAGPLMVYALARSMHRFAQTEM